MPLNRRQVIALSAAIKDRREQLIDEIRRDAARARGEPYAVHAGTVHDLGDESVAGLIADVEQAELSRDVEELKELDAASKRLADGSYGICTDCQDEIGAERLLARPGAPRCLACQERYEKAHANTGGASL